MLKHSATTHLLVQTIWSCHFLWPKNKMRNRRMLKLVQMRLGPSRKAKQKFLLKRMKKRTSQMWVGPTCILMHFLKFSWVFDAFRCAWVHLCYVFTCICCHSKCFETFLLHFNAFLLPLQSCWCNSATFSCVFAAFTCVLMHWCHDVLAFLLFLLMF